MGGYVGRRSQQSPFTDPASRSRRQYQSPTWNVRSIHNTDEEASNADNDIVLLGVKADPIA